MDIKILIAGDYCPIGRNAMTIKNQDYSKLFGGFEKFSNEADLSIVNLECPITNSKTKLKKTGPNIKASFDSLKPLKFAGFNLVTLANNHILDYGSQGLMDTMANCELEGISYVGAGKNNDEARKPFFTTIKNKKIAIINIAENEFCTTTDENYGANPLNVISNHYDIIKAKKTADYVIVISHGGREHYQLPSPQLKERYRYFIDSGADAVISHHTHCFSGYEYYMNKPIFYSLGNFIFDYKKKYQKGLWTQGFSVLLRLNNNDTIDFELIPFNQGREENPSLVLMDELEQRIFNSKLEELNAIIKDEKLILSNWEKYIKSQMKAYKGNMFVQNKYIRALINKGILPDFFFHSSEHQYLLLNLLKCETHREIMIDVLTKKLE